MTRKRREGEHRAALIRFYDAFNARDLPRIPAEREGKLERLTYADGRAPDEATRHDLG
jgi:hypothetical protein